MYHDLRPQRLHPADVNLVLACDPDRNVRDKPTTPSISITTGKRAKVLNPSFG